MATLSGTTTYHHDAAGNRMQVDHPDGTSDYFTWDALGRMTVAEVGDNVTTLSYNAAGRRVIKETPTGATSFRYDHKRQGNMFDHFCSAWVGENFLSSE